MLPMLPVERTLPEPLPVMVTTLLSKLPAPPPVMLPLIKIDWKAPALNSPELSPDPPMREPVEGYGREKLDRSNRPLGENGTADRGVGADQ